METIYILTAELDPASFVQLDGLRRQHFPSERNLLSAHLTMFHRLSPVQTAGLGALALPAAAVPIWLEGPVLIGSGVAIRIRSPEVEHLRAAARDAMGGDFSRQDGQGWRPHVTIQNKVHVDAAKALHRALAGDFEPSIGTLTGLLVWEYLGGPWKLSQRLPFA